MGFMEKMKNLFTEEEEIEEPVKKEVMQVEIKAPTVQREKVHEPEVEVEPPVMKVQQPTPVFFDDKDFATLEQPKPKPKPKPVEKKPERTAYNSGRDRKDRHSFKPSPIISPVYGILDKNYKKEDIVDRGETEIISSYNRVSREMTLDEVRQKAFGTLEDDIDLNLHAEKEEKEEVVTPVYDKSTLENDIFEEMESDTPHTSLEETDDVTIGNISEAPRMDVINNDEVGNEETNDETIDESDLFNLIDSMYEKRDEE